MSSQTAENYKNLGNKEYAAGNFSKAIEFYTDAVESDPKNHIYVTNRSAAYAAMKNWEKSLKDAETSIALKADWVKGYWRKGAALQALNRMKEATAAFRKACTLEPNNNDIKKSFDECKKQWYATLSPAAQKKEDGNEFYQLGKINEAIDAYTKAAALCKPDENMVKSDIFCNRALCYVNLYEPVNIVQDCTESLRYNPNNVKALSRRGTAYESLDKMKLALADFELAAKLEPNLMMAVHGADRVRKALKADGMI